MAKNKKSREQELFEHFDDLMKRGFFVKVDVTGNFTYDFAVHSCSKDVIFQYSYSWESFATYYDALEKGIEEAERIYEDIKETPNFNERIKQENDYYNLPF